MDEQTIFQEVVAATRDFMVKRRYHPKYLNISIDDYLCMMLDEKMKPHIRREGNGKIFIMGLEVIKDDKLERWYLS